MRSPLSRCVALLVLTAALCGAQNTRPTPASISVGGTYRTAVTLESSSCRTAPTIERHDTTVTQAAGSTSLTVAHAGNRYEGALANDGTFTTRPIVLSGEGATYTIGIDGAFTATALDALVTVEVRGRGACRYLVRWAGPKEGEPNVIP